MIIYRGIPTYDSGQHYSMSSKLLARKFISKDVLNTHVVYVCVCGVGAGVVGRRWKGGVFRWKCNKSEALFCLVCVIYLKYQMTEIRFIFSN